MTVDWLTSGQGSGTDVNLAIERYRRAIADNTLSGNMTLGNGDVGSYAMAETQADREGLQVEVDAHLIETAWGMGLDGVSPIERQIRLNYGPQDAYPRLSFTDLRSRDYSGHANSLATLAQSGNLSPEGRRRFEQWLLRHIDIDLPLEEIAYMEGAALAA